jgi:fumarate reductase subunit D
MAEEDQDKDSFVRWQAATRDHLSSVANLVLALATGLLAFQSTLLLEHKLSSYCAFGFAFASLFLLSASVVFALWCAINRLRDSRLTMRISRLRQKGDTDLQELRDESKSLGKATWRLFCFQVSLFGLGAGCSALAVVVQVWPK